MNKLLIILISVFLTIVVATTVCCSSTGACQAPSTAMARISSDNMINYDDDTLYIHLFKYEFNEEDIQAIHTLANHFNVVVKIPEELR